MALAITHPFVNPKGDPVDATIVRPSNWNAAHTMMTAPDVVIGGVAGGAAVEIPCGSFARSLLACTSVTDLQALFGLFTTGDFKPTIKLTADPGWVMIDDGTIGDASSGASNRANADTWPLFNALYNVSDSYAPVSGGRTSAAADFALHKKISLTRMLGRALAAAGAGSGLTSRVLGSTFGEENHTLLETELAAHNHGGVTGNDSPDHTHTFGNFVGNQNSAGGGGSLAGFASTGTTSGASTRHTHTIASDGSGAAHNNVQPTLYVNFMLKL